MSIIYHLPFHFTLVNVIFKDLDSKYSLAPPSVTPHFWIAKKRNVWSNAHSHEDIFIRAFSVCHLSYSMQLLPPHFLSMHCLIQSCPPWMLQEDILSDQLFTLHKSTSSGMCECLSSTLQHFIGSKPTTHAQRWPIGPESARGRETEYMNIQQLQGWRLTLARIISGDFWGPKERHPAPNDANPTCTA